MPAPVVTLAAPLGADTVRELAFYDSVTVQAATRVRDVAITLDAGTPRARTLPVDEAFVEAGRAKGRFMLPITLGTTPSGTHRFTVTATDSAGRTGSATANVEVRLPIVAYAMRVLPTPSDTVWTSEKVWARDLNDRGDAVGGVQDPAGLYQPLLWRDGAVVRLQTGPFAAGIATAINNAGEIAGNLANRADLSGPAMTRWTTADAFPTATYANGSGCSCSVADLNDRGTILVSGVLPGLWRRDGSFEPLDRTNATTYFLDANDDVYGDQWSGSYYRWAVRWTPAIETVRCPPEATTLRGVFCEVYAGADGGVLLARVGELGELQMLRMSDGRWFDLTHRLAGSTVPAVAADGEVVALHAATNTIVLWKDGVTRLVALPTGDWDVRRVVAINRAKQILAQVRDRATRAMYLVLLSPGA